MKKYNINIITVIIVIVITVLFGSCGGSNSYFASEPDNTVELKEIGSYEISLAKASSMNSIVNALISASEVNNYVVNSGEIFSFNKVVGERLQYKGYLSAPITSLEEKTVYSYGGGICLTATAIHQAVKQVDGLKVIERHNHVTAVNYAARGEDAAIMWGYQDYKFKNNRANPLTIAVYEENNAIIVKLYEVMPIIEVNDLVIEDTKVEFANKPLIVDDATYMDMDELVHFNQVAGAGLANTAEVAEKKIINGKSMVKLRSLCEGLGLALSWIPGEQKIAISMVK